jgi:hypothetical protein
MNVGTERTALADTRRSFHEAISQHRNVRMAKAAHYRRAADRLEALRKEGGHDEDGLLGQSVIALHDMARSLERT